MKSAITSVLALGDIIAAERKANPRVPKTCIIVVCLVALCLQSSLSAPVCRAQPTSAVSGAAPPAAVLAAQPEAPDPEFPLCPDCGDDLVHPERPLCSACQDAADLRDEA